MPSKVVHPDHYNEGKKLETWDWIAAGLSDVQYEGYLLGNALKYLHRYDKKGGEEDLQKAQEYINKLKDFKYPPRNEK